MYAFLIYVTKGRFDAATIWRLKSGKFMSFPPNDVEDLSQILPTASASRYRLDADIIGRIVYEVNHNFRRTGQIPVQEFFSRRYMAACAFMTKEWRAEVVVQDDVWVEHVRMAFRRWGEQGNRLPWTQPFSDIVVRNITN